MNSCFRNFSMILQITLLLVLTHPEWPVPLTSTTSVLTSILDWYGTLQLQWGVVWWESTTLVTALQTVNQVWFLLCSWDMVCAEFLLNLVSVLHICTSRSWRPLTSAMWDGSSNVTHSKWVSNNSASYWWSTMILSVKITMQLTGLNKWRWKHSRN